MRSVQTAALAAAVSLVACAARAQTYTPCPLASGTTGVCGATVTSTPQALTLSMSRGYQRIVNNGPGTLWCTRDSKATPAPKGVSSYPITPVKPEEYPIAGTTYVPPEATTCMSVSGAINVAVETN